MKWFKHFSNAHNDNALNKIRMRYGADGYAIYWYCLELIAGDLEGENANFELSHDAEVIGFNLKVDQLRVEEIMRYMVDLKLFEQSGSAITCLKLAKFLEKNFTRNKEIHKIIDKFKDIQSVSDKSGHVSDSLKHSALDEKRREEIRTSTYNSPPPMESKKHPRTSSLDSKFDLFWNEYPKKKNKADAQKAWMKLNPPIDDLLKALQWQKPSTDWQKSKGQFIPYPASYLNSNGWLDEPEVITRPLMKGKL